MWSHKKYSNPPAEACCSFAGHNLIPPRPGVKGGLTSVSLAVIPTPCYLLGQRRQDGNATWAHVLPWRGWIMVQSFFRDSWSPLVYGSFCRAEVNMDKHVIDLCVAWTILNSSSKEKEFQWPLTEKSPSSYGERFLESLETWLAPTYEDSRLCYQG